MFVHPQPDAFAERLRDATAAALGEAGHDVMVLDPYKDGLDAAMSLDELNAYTTNPVTTDPIVVRYASAVEHASTLAFVFPMWWSGPPSMLKGFFDRVLAPGVAFRMADNGRILPGLRHVRQVCVITGAEPPGHFPHRSVRHLARRFARSLRRATGRGTKLVVEWASPGIRGDEQAEADFINHVRRQLSRRTAGDPS